MSHHTMGHALHGAAEVVKGLKPLPTKKDPQTAAICGLFGAFGLGLYFRTIQDVFVPIILWILLAIVGLPTGELLFLLAPLFTAAYGYYRATSSNEALEAELRKRSAAPPVHSGPNGSVPPASPTSEPANAGGFTIEARIQRLKRLKEQGEISASEYELKRLQILAEL